MIERHLKITLEFARQGAQQAQRQYFDGLRRDIDDAAKFERQQDRRTGEENRRRMAEMQAAAREFARYTEGLRRKQAQAAIRAQKEELDAQRSSAAARLRIMQDMHDRTMNATREWLRAFRHSKKMEVQISKEVAAEHRAIDRETFRKFDELHRARMKDERDGVRIAAQAKRDARRSVAQQARTDAKRERQEEAEQDKRSAADRLAFYVDQAKAKSEIAHRTSREAVQSASAANAALRRGEEELAGAHQLVAEGKVRTSREAAEKSAGFAKKAASQINAATKGEGDAARETARVIVAGAKDSSEAAARYADRGSRAVVTSWKRAGDGQQEVAKKTANALDQQQRQILRVSDAYTLMRGAAIVNQATMGTFRAMGEEAHAADRHIEDIVGHMKEMREEMAEIMAMRGESLSGPNAAEVAGRAASNAVSVGMQKQFESELQSQMQEVIGKRITQPEIDAMGIPTYVAAMGGNASTEGSAARVLDAIVRVAPTNKEGRVNTEQVQADFADIMESVQVGKGHNATAASQVSEAINEYGGPGKMIEDPRKVAALMRVFMVGNEQKGSTIFNAMMKGQLQIRKDEEKMERLGAYGVTGKESGEDFLFKSLEAIQKMAGDEGRDYHTVLSEFYGAIREFQGSELLKINRQAYDDALQGMKGGTAKMKGRIAAYRKMPLAESRAADSQLSRAQAQAGSKYHALDILETEALTDLTSSGDLERRAGAIESAAGAAGRKLTMEERTGFFRYQEAGRRIRGGLEQYKEDDDVARFLATEGGGLTLGANPMNWFRDRERQMRGLKLLRKTQSQARDRTTDGLSPIAPGAVSLHSQARKAAAAQLKAEGVDPGNPGYREATDSRANELLGPFLPRGSKVGNPTGATGFGAAVARFFERAEVGPAATPPAGDRGKAMAEAIHGAGAGRAEAAMRAMGWDPTSGNARANDAHERRRAAAAAANQPAIDEAVKGIRSVPPAAPGVAMQIQRNMMNGTPAEQQAFNIGPRGVGLMASAMMAHVGGGGPAAIGRAGVRRDARGRISLPGSDGRLRPGTRSAMRNRAAANMPIEILTDADRSRRAGWAANTRALSEPRRRAAASASAEAANRAAANKASHDSERARAAMHIAENHRFLEARRVAALPTPRANIPKPEFPDSGFGRGPLARAAGGMLKPGPGMPGNYAPAPGTYPRRVATTSGFGSGYEPEGWMFSPPNMAPNGLPGANAIQGWAGRWGRGEYATRGDEGINALRILGGGRPGGGGDGGASGARHLKEAANALKESARGPVPSAMPGKPNVMRN